MSFWGCFLGFFIGVASKLLGDILSPAVAELGPRLSALIHKKPYISGQLAAEISALETTAALLLRIDRIPQDPDPSLKTLPEWLMDIDTNARKIRSKSLLDMRAKLIAFAAPMNQIGSGTGLREAQDLFIKGGKAHSLVEEIRKVIAEKTNAKTR